MSAAAPFLLADICCPQSAVSTNGWRHEGNWTCSKTVRLEDRRLEDLFRRNDFRIARLEQHIGQLVDALLRPRAWFAQTSFSMSIAPAEIGRSTLGLHTLEQYEPLIGAAATDRINRKAESVCTQHVVHVSSTFYGGGVAELLTPLTLLMNATGIQTEWHIIQGTNAFFTCTKKLHNTLQGESVQLPDVEKDIYEQVAAENALRLNLDDCDAVIVHDPQPLPLVRHFPNRTLPVWQCHIDLSSPNLPVAYLREFVDDYDAAIFLFARIRQGPESQPAIIMPAIIPFPQRTAN